LAENIQAFISFIVNNKPTGVKGHFIKSVCVSGTMTPGIHIAV
jgi:ribosomal protein L1